MMNIDILHLTEGARQATGLTVIIDVFRAFSLECYLYEQNAKLIIPVADVEQAFNLKKENPDFVLIGEREEKKVPGFDFGNSPTHILSMDFSGRTIVHTTSAGTRGIFNAINAKEIITGSFVNAEAIIRYIKKNMYKDVSLVCMGYSAQTQTEEDNLCAEYISGRLRNETPDFQKMVEIIKQTSGKRFFDKTKASYCPSNDFNLCLQLSRFNFIIRAIRQADGTIFNQKIEI